MKRTIPKKTNQMVSGEVAKVAEKISIRMKVSENDIKLRLQELIDTGGDLDLLSEQIEYCFAQSFDYTESLEKLNWKKNNFKDLMNAADKLKIALSRCKAPLLDWGSGNIGNATLALRHYWREIDLPEDVGIQLISLNQKRYALLEDAAYSGDCGKTGLKEILLRLREEAKLFHDLVNLRAITSAQRGHGAQSVHCWLAFFVPYTASLDVKLKPNWAWIDSWLALIDSKGPSSRKLWNKTITERLKKKQSINPNLQRIYKNIIGAWWKWVLLKNVDPLRISSKKRENPAECPEAKQMLKVLNKLCPFISRSSFESLERCLQVPPPQYFSFPLKSPNRSKKLIPKFKRTRY